MIHPEKAWKKLEKYLEAIPAEEVSRVDSAGRVLASDLAATVDVPGTDVSAMDGYAVSGEVAPGEPIPVVGTAAAGDPPGLAIQPGQAARIMTGATVPDGADRVIQVEWSDDGDATVRFERSTESGAHIRRRGEILEAGAPVLAAGAPLTPGALALVATHGYSTVPVVGRPRVAVLTTGDEVIRPEETPRPGQLRDSNTDTLLAAGRTLGLRFEALGTAPDDRDALRRSVERGLEYDVLLLCGGVSKGEYDFVEEILERAGCTLLFDAVAIQPGKPLVAAVRGRDLVFGLPGNPASVMAGFWLFVRPALRCRMGIPDAYWQGAILGELVGALPPAKGRDRFLSADVWFENGTARVLPIPNKGSHDIASYGRGNALARVPAHSPPRGAGEPCEVLPFADWSVPPPKSS